MQTRRLVIATITNQIKGVYLKTFIGAGAEWRAKESLKKCSTYTNNSSEKD